MYATADDVAAHLGRPLTSDEATQIALWIGWLESDIIERFPNRSTLSAALLQRAIVESVAAYMRNPDDATQVSEDISVDDGRWQRSRRYQTSTGRVELLPHWWTRLGWVEPSVRQVFSIRPHYVPDARGSW